MDLHVENRKPGTMNVKENTDETTPFEETTPIKDLEVTDVIGNFGRWQLRICFAIYMIKFIGPFQNLSAVFLAPKVPYRCAEKTGNHSLLGNDSWLSDPKSDECRFEVEDLNGTQFLDCQHWEYDHSTFESTLTEKFDLVCDKSWLISLSQSMYMIGFLAACIVLGHLADKIGRRPVCLIGMVCLVFADILCLYSPNYIVYAVSQFFTGFGRTGMLNATYILLLEIVGTKYRSLAGVVLGSGFGLGYMVFPGVAFALRDWFYIQLCTTLLAVFVASMFWLIPESPRWLLLNNKLNTAESVIEKAVYANRRKIVISRSTVNVLAKMTKKDSEYKGNEKISVFELLKTPNMRRKTCVLFYLWFVIAFVYYGFSFNIQNIGGNIFLNFFLFGAAELPGIVFVILGQRYFGRKTVLIFTMMVIGVCCLGILPATYCNLKWLRTALATVGKAMVRAAFEIVYVYAVEIFPTKLRSVGMTSCSVWARVGGIISPFMKELGKGNDFMIPMGLFGGLSITCASISILLPETKGCPLPDTLEQGEMFGKTSNSRRTKKEDKIALSRFPLKNETTKDVQSYNV